MSDEPGSAIGAPAELATANVHGCLEAARALGVDRLDAHLLLARGLGCRREWLIAHDDAPVPAKAARGFLADLARRAAGEPLAYLLGEREFHGLTLQVGPGVLVPRPDTETLVGRALALLDGALGHLDTPAVVDLGTGSGAIALAVLSTCPRARVTGVDISPVALAWARGNAARLRLQVAWAEGRWWEAVPDQRFHLALANPPYIAEGDPHLAALRYEPAQALVAGDAGLADLHHLVDTTPAHLHPGGWLLLEHGFEQGAAVAARLRARGYTDVQTVPDLEGRPRCTGGRWP